MIDLHSHILAGIDDGAASLAESVELARVAAAGGVRAIAATPHVRTDYPTRAEEMERGVEELRRELERREIPVQILPGGEIGLDLLGELDPDELGRFGLGGNPSYLLLETPYTSWPRGSDRQIVELARSGITPVLAHPERNADVQRDLERVARFVRAGALVQLTAASLTGGAGPAARETAFALLEAEAAHLVASDAHGAHVRRAGLGEVGGSVEDERLARWLTDEMPAAIVGGRELPPRPERSQQRRRSRWRFAF